MPGMHPQPSLWCWHWNDATCTRDLWRVTNDDKWLQMMTNDDKWWQMMTNDDKWWQMMTMMTNDDTWWHMMTHDDTWWHMMTHDDTWWHMMTHDDTWWQMMTNDDKWWQMMTNAPKKIKKGTAVTLLYPQKKGPFLQTKLQIPAKKTQHWKEGFWIFWDILKISSLPTIQRWR